jgi:predicted kinase
VTQLTQPTLIVVCGLPLSGKTEYSERIGAELGIRAIDIDRDLRMPVLGPPGASGTPLDGKQMGAAYALMFCAIEQHLKFGWSAVFTATFSSHKWGQTVLDNLFSGYPDFHVRIVWCVLGENTDEEIQRRIDKREAIYTGPVRSIARFRELEAKYDPIVLSGHLRLDTSPTRPIEECAAEALRYVLS